MGQRILPLMQYQIDLVDHYFTSTIPASVIARDNGVALNKLKRWIAKSDNYAERYQARLQRIDDELQPKIDKVKALYLANTPIKQIVHEVGLNHTRSVYRLLDKAHVTGNRKIKRRARV